MADTLKERLEYVGRGMNVIGKRLNRTADDLSGLSEDLTSDVARKMLALYIASIRADANEFLESKNVRD